MASSIVRVRRGAETHTGREVRLIQVQTDPALAPPMADRQIAAATSNLGEAA